MNSSIILKKLKVSARLEKLITQNASKESILKQSKIVDKYISIQLRQMNMYNNIKNKKGM